MEISEGHRKKITWWLIAVFLLLLADRWLNGMLLTQLQPAFFAARMDVFTWLVMYTGIHEWLLNNPSGWMTFDSLFITFPLVYLLCYIMRPSFAPVIAWLWLLNNWLYIQCYTLYPSNSIEATLAWLILPLIFTASRLINFYLLMHLMRYCFLWIMVSAGLWKLWQHGLFNYHQMSAILYMQHKEFMVSSPDGWLSGVYYWLIAHPAIGYLLYVLSAIIEMCFITGFITRKFDRVLIALFFIFFAADVFVMRIKYWELSPFVVILFYAYLTIPKHSLNNGKKYR